MNATLSAGSNAVLTLVSAHSISGAVTAGGKGLANATITLGTQTAPTDAQGNYTFSGLLDGPYTATPSLDFYSF